MYERKKVILTLDNGYKKFEDYLLLTIEQIDLLEWLAENDWLYSDVKYTILKEERGFQIIQREGLCPSA